MGRLAVLIAAMAAVVAAGGCGSDRTGGLRGSPQEVVDAAPDRTIAAGSARFDAGAPNDQRRGAVDFTEPAAAADAGRYPELSDPAAVVDLVRGAEQAGSYGGAAVRGASTFRYEAVVNVERAVAETPPDRRPAVRALAERLRAPAFYVDLWIDSDGRLRRVQIPVEKTTERPAARSRELPAFVTVDFFDFAGD